MRVRVQFFAILRDWVGIQTEWIDVADGTTVEQLWHTYAARHPRAQTARIAYAVNRKLVSADYTLRENDHVDFLPPISGGATPLGLSSFVVRLSFGVPAQPLDLFDPQMNNCAQ